MQGSLERSVRLIRVDHLVGTVEIARRLGVRDHNVVNTWRRRHADFPEPLVDLYHGRLWAWPDVDMWARRTGRGTVHAEEQQRPVGRH